MGTILRALVSLVVAFVGTVMIAGAILKASVHYIRPPEYGPPWLHVLTLGVIFGSLVLSPILFALCYRFLYRKAPKTIV
jgi:uncharacterized BrkB/YihY/UPF0761 family membrane protein